MVEQSVRSSLKVSSKVRGKIAESNRPIVKPSVIGEECIYMYPGSGHRFCGLQNGMATSKVTSSCSALTTVLTFNC